MATIKSFLLVTFLLTCSFCFSQLNSPSFGLFTPEEINMKECPFDPEAEAIILLDEAATDYVESYKMATWRRIRIKILNSKGIERANVVIPFYSHDNFEVITEIEGATHNFNGSEQVTINLDKKTIYTEKINTYFSEVKFAMPQVKEGSIIEYKYKSVMDSYSGLDVWDFQSDIPTLKSAYLLYLPPVLDISYKIQKDHSLFLKSEQVPDARGMRFEMYNIPALRNEPFMDARNDYVQRIIFQISGVLQRNGRFTLDIKKDWNSAARELLASRMFGKLIEKKLMIEELKMAVEKESSLSGKINTIYTYVRDNFSWNGANSKFAEGFDQLLNTRTGHSGEINLLLLNLLNAFGIETKPVLVSERQNGKIDPSYPFLEEFNKVVALCIADGKKFIMDATQKFTPCHLVPASLLNTTAFVLHKKNSELLNISNNASHKSNLFINAKLKESGEIEGDTKIESYNYAKIARLTQLQNEKDEFFLYHFEQPHEAMSVNDPETLDPGIDSSVLYQHFNFKQQLTKSGEFMIFRYNLFTALEKNPFVSTTRFTNINFGFPYEVTVEETIKLPQEAIPEIPETKTLKTNDGKIIVHRDIKFDNSTLNVRLIFIQSLTSVMADSYSELRNFYKNMAEILNEPILIRMAK